MLSPKLNFAAHGQPVGLAASAANAADDTYVAGAAVDITSNQHPHSAMGIVALHFLSASGAGVATNILTIDIETDDNSSFTSATSLLSSVYTYTYTWAADGDNSGLFYIPVNLSAAEQYVRIKAKLTEAGTITVTEQFIVPALILGGFSTVPHASYAAAGVAQTVEPSA